MNEGYSADHLFEVSWEVCNKVGGIYTVLKTKAEYAVNHFGDKYILIGPDVGNNPDFEENNNDIWGEVKNEVNKRNLTCRCGRWNTAGNPYAILVNHNNKYQVDKLLFQLWQDYGVDSRTGGWDYIEPVLFSSAAGEVIQILHQLIVKEGETAVAQFHEWMTSAGMLYVKKHVPAISTVLTTHATMLGRSLAGSGVDIYTNIDDIPPQEMAAKMNIAAKHSMETVSAREADCFTTVSEITARETSHFLQREPHMILPNGINIKNIPDCHEETEAIHERRRILLGFASKFLKDELNPENTKILMISGRYEFRNKGIDLFLESLKKLNDSLKETKSHTKMVAFLCVVNGNMGISGYVQQILKGEDAQRSGISAICTHQLQDPQHDPIWNACTNLGLFNAPDDAVKIIFMPVYLDGYDGLLNMPYYDVLTGCDLGVFPSYYEPWGYTPLESASYCVPTVTTDLAGFGMWVKDHFDNENNGVIILDYNGRTHEQIVECLKSHMENLLKWTGEKITDHRKQARIIAEKTDWGEFYPFYLHAYSIAVKSTKDRLRVLDTGVYRQEIYYTGTDSLRPRFKSFSVIATLPESIGHLRDIACNLWWTWNPELQELFARLDTQLWKDTSNNPIEMLERVSSDRLQEMSKNESYLRLYNSAMRLVKNMFSDDKLSFLHDTPITKERPIAYFSTEYGLHESLPIYSGGLGILSGDHLKSASNLNIPMIGVGLLYKNGYFQQTLDKEGNQTALYPENDFSLMPVRIFENNNREPVKIQVDLPGRKLYAQVWKVDVGRVTLYLLDTYVSENSGTDMQITSRLYDADQRLRIEQEIMLGIGGVRLLEALGIAPALYHLNEGHSAFLLLERIQNLMEKTGLNFYEAKEVVKASSVFTTHSPVEAANERFEESLMKNYFSEYISNFGISWETFWELGCEEPGIGKPFLMSALAFKLCSASNAVSKLHGQIARKMWKNIWSGFEENEIPIMHITNGIHMQSWVAPEMKELYERHLGIDWYSKNFDTANWNKINEIPDKLLWQTHMELKVKMIDYLKEKGSSEGDRQGISPQIIQRKMASFDPNALIIGFGRRFATYKRATLIFEDLDRLLTILENPEKPVQIIFAGKAHPNDEAGKKLIKQIYSYTLDDRFIDKIFFVENHDLRVARHLVQGVDLWLNNPLRLREASGTSGMKVVVNGGLNISTLDGWWDEAFQDNGWVIGGRDEYTNLETQNIIDSQSIYDILENSVLPAYFRRNAEGIPEQWIYMMMRSIETLVPQYNTHRMLREYCEKMYVPVARRASMLQADDYARAKALSDWKAKIASRFSTDHIKWYRVKGFRGDRLDLGDEIEIQAGVEFGKLSADEIRVELVVSESDESARSKKPVIIPMEKTATSDVEDTIVYYGTYRAIKSGRFVYGIRVMPGHPDLLLYQELGLVHWA